MGSVRSGTLVIVATGMLSCARTGAPIHAEPSVPPGPSSTGTFAAARPTAAANAAPTAVAMATAAPLPSAPPTAAGTAAAMAPTPAGPPAWTTLLKRVGAGYTQYAKADQQMFFAPQLCAPAAMAPRLPVSAAPAAPHGGKVYFVYAKDVPSYTAGARTDVRPSAIPGDDGASQVIVKETWAAVEGGTKGDKGPLFIMAKLRATKGTDDGWIFGLVSADGRDVLDAGVIATCSGCHKNATHDHQFGPPGR